jgi:class 3 adenylate cyclase/pSer/pThr/pTyr-binding forkhead associated (FHA) protein
MMPSVAHLTITEGEKRGEVYSILDSPFKIGRMPDNDIVFSDKSVSRYHAEILIQKDAHLLRDLGSSNGTLLNNARITSIKLHAGDSVTIGTNTILFDLEKDDIFPEDETPDTTTVKPARDILKDIIEEKIDDVSVDRSRRQNILGALYQLSKSILKESEMRSILHLTVDIILKNIAAERIYILIKDKDSDSVSPLFSRDIYTRIGQHLLDAGIVTANQIQEALSLQKKEGGKLGTKLIKLGHITEDTLNTFLTKQSGKENRLMLSKSLINRVMNEEISLLVADAKRDSRFSESKSIFLYGIRSAMCVPLLGTGHVAGAIYVDNLNAGKQFTQDDINLLTTIGNLAAISIEEANLREKIRKEREARQCLMRYHSPQVVDEIIKGGGMCEVNERMITVLFIDIKDFTRLSEELGPMGSATLLNEYFDIIIDAVFRYKGSVDKFIGDAVMAIFSPPFLTTGHTEMAVRAAVDIQERIQKLRKYEIRIGINTGPAVIGNIGSSKRMEYTAIGDTVNIASRLEKMASPGKIYIGEATYQQIKDIFNIRPVGIKKVKGKVIEVDVYEVLI